MNRVKRYQKSLISTERLLQFARQRGLRLGRTNPRRTLNLYIRLGLLPPRIRTYEGRLNWGFPTYAKALLVRICRLREQGRSLAQIKGIVEKEVEESYEVFKRPDRTLGGLEDAFSDPIYDYNHDFAHREVKYALYCLRKGQVEEAEQILRDLSAVLEPPAKGERHVIVVRHRELPADFLSKESPKSVRPKRGEAVHKGGKHHKKVVTYVVRSH